MFLSTLGSRLVFVKLGVCFRHVWHRAEMSSFIRLRRRHVFPNQVPVADG